MSSSNAYEPAHDPGGTRNAAADAGDPSSARRGERRREILRADPYYPHTALRAVTMWFALALFCLGFAALATLVIPNREFGWYYVVSAAIIATVFVGGQLLLHSFSVGRLEDWGKISRRPESTGSPNAVCAPDDRDGQAHGPTTAGA